MTDFKITIDSEAAPRLAEWMVKDCGLARWDSVNLSNPGASWITPATATRKPNWQADSQPALFVTEPEEVGVTTYKEVKRFHVAVRRGSQGLSLKLTDASSAKVRKAVNQAGDGATYQFDYFFQEAVILAPAEMISLADWMRRQQAEASA